MIYLASVYSIGAKTNSGADRTLREKRYRYALRQAANLIMEREHVFCPVVHGHHMSCEFDLPKDYKYWKDYDHEMILLCDDLYVLKMPRWKESEGISDEIKFAKINGKRVVYISCPDYTED